VLSLRRKWTLSLPTSALYNSATYLCIHTLQLCRHFISARRPAIWLRLCAPSLSLATGPIIIYGSFWHGIWRTRGKPSPPTRISVATCADSAIHGRVVSKSRIRPPHCSRQPAQRPMRAITKPSSIRQLMLPTRRRKRPRATFSPSIVRFNTRCWLSLYTRRHACLYVQSTSQSIYWTKSSSSHAKYSKIFV